MQESRRRDGMGGVAFVLGGGGELGGYQVGMLRALFERDIRPQWIVGTSVGSIQGAMVARDPTSSVCDELAQFWRDFVAQRVLRTSVRAVLGNALRMRPAIGSNAALHGLLRQYFGDEQRIEDLAVPYQACAASVERATARYFDSGPLLPALMASCAIPGIWPPVRIGAEHYVDGGVVETVPMKRALVHGVTEIYVLPLRQRNQPLRPPRFPWQLAGVVYELSRRHRLGQVINSRVPGVAVHVLPSGEEFMEPPDNGAHTSEAEQLATINRRIEQGYRSAAGYLRAARDGSAGSRGGSVRFHSVEPAGRRPELAAVSVSPFVTAKLHDHFALYDRDDDGRVSAAEFRQAALRIADAFGHPADSTSTTMLADTYAEYWRRLCVAVGEPADATLDRDAFGRALTRLAGDVEAYTGNVLPVVAAALAAADRDGDRLLDEEEIRRLLRSLGVAPDEVAVVARRLDANGDGVVSVDELGDAFRDYFTSDEPGCVGNLIFGSRG